MPAVLILAGCSGGSPAPSAASTGKHAIFLGDSYFNATGSVATYAAISGRALGYSVQIAGKGANGFQQQIPPTAAVSYAGFVKAAGGFTALAKGAPDEDLIVIEGGLNDPDAGPAEEQAAETLVSQAGAAFPDARLVLMGPPRPTGLPAKQLSDVTTALGLAAKAEGVPFIDQSSWITPANRASIIGSDGVTPTAAGYVILAKLLTAALRPLGS